MPMANRLIHLAFFHSHSPLSPSHLCKVPIDSQTLHLSGGIHILLGPLFLYLSTQATLTWFFFFSKNVMLPLIQNTDASGKYSNYAAASLTKIYHWLKIHCICTSTDPQKVCASQERCILWCIIGLQSRVPKQGSETAYPEHGVCASIQYPQKSPFRGQLSKAKCV